jgi:flagellar hook-associated protein 2
MAAITSTGVGSGLDVNGLVTQLVAAERAAQDKRLTRIDTQLTTEFTALSQLKGSLGGFQAALSGLKDASTLIGRKASLSDSTNLTASAASTATAGVYDVEVVQLAKAAQLGSIAFTGGPTTVVGTGTLTLAQGSDAFTVTIDSTNNTLAGIRDAINASVNNTGIRATILTGVDGSRLILSGSKTGASNALKVNQSGGDGGLNQLVYDPPATNGNLSALTSIITAQDAIVNISGFPVHSATNTVDKAIDGVTLNLLKQAPGTLVTLTVANDDAAVASKVNGFVSAYNALAKQVATLRSYNADTKASGPMLGDAMLLNIEGQLRRIISSPVTGATPPYTTLANLGITSSLDGTLSVDATKLQTALTTNSASVSSVFGSTNGVATKLSAFIDLHLSSSGDITARNDGIAAQRKDLTKAQEALNARMAVIQARYQKQFNALDSLLTKMQSTSSYLTQQLASSTTLAKGAGG